LDVPLNPPRIPFEATSVQWPALARLARPLGGLHLGAAVAWFVDMEVSIVMGVPQ
jgi:hypothetical protein